MTSNPFLKAVPATKPKSILQRALQIQKTDNKVSLQTQDVFEPENRKDQNDQINPSINSAEPLKKYAPSPVISQISPIVEVQPSFTKSKRESLRIAISICDIECQVNMEDKGNYMNVHDSVSVGINLALKSMVKTVWQQINVTNQIFGRYIFIDNRQLLTKLQKHKSKAQFNPKEINRLLMGFSFYENDPTLRNKFSFLLKNHVWRQLVGVVEVKLNVDSLIAFYIVAFVHLQKGAIKRISFCEQIQSIHCVKESEIVGLAQDFLQMDKLNLVRVYELMIADQRPSQAHLIRPNEQLLILRTLVAVLATQSGQLAAECVRLFHKYWEKALLSEKKKGSQLSEIFGSMLQIVKDKTLKMELVQLQLDDNLSEENASDISPEVLVGPFKYLHAFFVRDQLIDFGVALQELQKITSLSEKWKCFFDRKLQKDLLSSNTVTDSLQARFIDSALQKLENLTNISDKSFDKYLNWCFRHTPLPEMTAIYLHMHSKRHKGHYILFLIWKQVIKFCKTIKQGHTSNSSCISLSVDHILELLDIIVKEYLQVDDIATLQCKINYGLYYHEQVHVFALVKHIDYLIQAYEERDRLRDKFYSIMSIMAKKNDITESLLYHDQQMRKIHSKYEEITSHLKANIMLVQDSKNMIQRQVVFRQILPQWIEQISEILRSGQVDLEKSVELLLWISDAKINRQLVLTQMTILLQPLHKQLLACFDKQDSSFNLSTKTSLFELIYRICLQFQCKSSPSISSLSQELLNCFSRQAGFASFLLHLKNISRTKMMELVIEIIQFKKNNKNSSLNFRQDIFCVLDQLDTTRSELAKQLLRSSVKCILQEKQPSLAKLCLSVARYDHFVLLQLIKQGMVSILTSVLVASPEQNCSPYIQLANELDVKVQQGRLLQDCSYSNLKQTILRKLLQHRSIQPTLSYATLVMCMNSINTLQLNLHFIFLSRLYSVLLMQEVFDRLQQQDQLLQRFGEYCLYLLSLFIAKQVIAEPTSKQRQKDQFWIGIETLIKLGIHVIQVAKKFSMRLTDQKQIQLVVTFFSKLTKLLEGCPIKLWSNGTQKASHRLINAIAQYISSNYNLGGLNWEEQIRIISQVFSHPVSERQANTSAASIIRRGACRTQIEFDQSLNTALSNINTSITQKNNASFLLQLTDLITKNDKFVVNQIQIDPNTIFHLCHQLPLKIQFINLLMLIIPKVNSSNSSIFQQRGKLVRKVLREERFIDILSTHEHNFITIIELKKIFQFLNQVMLSPILCANQLVLLNSLSAIERLLSKAKLCLDRWSHVASLPLEQQLDEDIFQDSFFYDRGNPHSQIQVSLWKLIETYEKTKMIQEIVVFISSVNGLIDLKKADLVGRILAILKFILQKVIPLSKGKSWGAATTKIENYLNIHKLQRSNAIRNQFSEQFSIRTLRKVCRSICNYLIRLNLSAEALSTEDIRILQAYIQYDGL